MEKSQNKKVVVNDDSNNTDAISTTNVNNASPSQILDKRLSFDDMTKNKSDQQTNSGILVSTTFDDQRIMRYVVSIENNHRNSFSFSLFAR
jgi:hypothetical protein